MINNLYQYNRISEDISTTQMTEMAYNAQVITATLTS